jgi:peroxiredoxin
MTLTLVTPFQSNLRTCFGQLDTAYRASMEAATEHLRRSGMALRAKGQGDRAPDFALATRDGARIVLSDLLSRGPVVLSFFRGEWCSFCRLEMDALLEACPAIVHRGASLVMISPQGPSETLLDRSHRLEGLTVLTDPLNGVGLQYGLIFRMPDVLRHALLAVGVDLSHIYGTDAWLLPIPATYVIGSDGLITLAHIDPDFTQRLDPDTILAELDGLRTQCNGTVAGNHRTPR